jgi:hypothetical protein
MEKLKLNNRSGKLQEEGRTAALGVRGYSDLSSTKLNVKTRERGTQRASCPTREIVYAPRMIERRRVSLRGQNPQVDQFRQVRVVRFRRPLRSETIRLLLEAAPRVRKGMMMVLRFLPLRQRTHGPGPVRIKSERDLGRRLFLFRKAGQR